MKYIFSIPEHHQRYVSVEVHIDGPFRGDPVTLRLPSWRPGRYELGNFAKNIKGFRVTDSSGNALPVTKVSKDSWLLHPVCDAIRVHYAYYAAQWDAGACWLDHDQLYINPVHCCVYTDEHRNAPCDVRVLVPDHWKLACGLPKAGPLQLRAANFDELVDSPFIASPSLQHAGYKLDGIDFNIWLQGNCSPDWLRIVKDFEEFTRVQLDTMKEFPVRDFHFLIQVLPHTFYHGVEHLNSTVLALGPGYKLMQKPVYKELVGVASHELFHSWNVKSVRPAEMMPYDYTRENYAPTGYVYEGVTTYYGDLFLARSGFFSLQELLDEYSVRLQKHMDNPGRFNYSVAESSFDTWLDGYVPGAPGRKVSIYDEGCLLAWILDFMIRSATGSGKSLDDVMRALYFEFAKKGIGYTAGDFRHIAEQIGGRSFESFFRDYVQTACGLDALLTEVVSLAGISIKVTGAENLAARFLGIRTEFRAGALVVSSVYPGSPAGKAGIQKEDELIAWNGTRIENNLSELLSGVESGKHHEMVVASSKSLRTLSVVPDAKNYYSVYTLEAGHELTQSQLQFRERWLGR